MGRLGASLVKSGGGWRLDVKGQRRWSAKQVREVHRLRAPCSRLLPARRPHLPPCRRERRMRALERWVLVCAHRNLGLVALAAAVHRQVVDHAGAHVIRKQPRAVGSRTVMGFGVVAGLVAGSGVGRRSRAGTRGAPARAGSAGSAAAGKHAANCADRCRRRRAPLVRHPAVDAAPPRVHPGDVLEAKVLAQRRIHNDDRTRHQRPARGRWGQGGGRAPSCGVVLRSRARGRARYPVNLPAGGVHSAVHTPMPTPLRCAANAGARTSSGCRCVRRCRRCARRRSL